MPVINFLNDFKGECDIFPPVLHFRLCYAFALINCLETHTFKIDYGFIDFKGLELSKLVTSTYFMLKKQGDPYCPYYIVDFGLII